MKEVHAAIDAAYDEYEHHMTQVRAKGAEIIARARAEHRHIIVLAGRPYHVDPEVNHGIDKLIIRQGAAGGNRRFRQLAMKKSLIPPC